jgi:hypothetical protein
MEDHSPRSWSDHAWPPFTNTGIRTAMQCNQLGATQMRHARYSGPTMHGRCQRVAKWLSLGSEMLTMSSNAGVYGLATNWCGGTRCAGFCCALDEGLKVCRREGAGRRQRGGSKNCACQTWLPNSILGTGSPHARKNKKTNFDNFADVKNEACNHWLNVCF